MPTYTVGSGKTYSTITAAIAAIPSNLSGTGIHEVIVDAGVYTTSVFINKSNPSASDYINIHCAVGSEHHGLTTAGVRLSGVDGLGRAMFTCWTNYTRVSDLVVTNTGAGGQADAFSFSSTNHVLTNLIGISGIGVSGAGQPSRSFQSATQNSFFICCLALNFVVTRGGTGFEVSGSGNAFYNCGVYNRSAGYSVTGSPISRNSFSANCTTGFNGSFSGTSSNNASTDSTAPGAGSIINKTIAEFGFTSFSTGNFHISPTSVLCAAGIDLSSTFTTDIDGTTIISWMIGLDYTPGYGSLLISGNVFLAARWPKPKISPAIAWVQDSAKYWNGSDRTSTQDAYETTCVFVDKESALNTLDTSLASAREAVSLSGFSYPIFAPNVDHTGTISAVVVSRKRKHLKWGYPKATAQVYALEVVFRAISPTILATSPSLSSLKLQEGFEAGDSYESKKDFTYNQTAIYGDNASDIGIFRGQFLQTTAQLQAILAYLLTTARATAFAFPNIGVAYPFGVNRGVYTGKNCKWKSIEINRRDYVFWDLSLELAEA